MRAFILATLKLFISHFVAIHNGTLSAKITSSIFLATMITPFAYASHWLDNNFAYLVLVISSLIMDLILGVYVHAIHFKDFKLKKMVSGFLMKFLFTISGLLMFEIFKAVFEENHVELGDYFKLTIALIVVSYPLFSAFGNLFVATNEKFPPIGWMDRIKKFQENLNTNELKK